MAVHDTAHLTVARFERLLVRLVRAAEHEPVATRDQIEPAAVRHIVGDVGLWEEHGELALISAGTTRETDDCYTTRIHHWRRHDADRE